jgi:hypothetical protein
LRSSCLRIFARWQGILELRSGIYHSDRRKSPTSLLVDSPLFGRTSNYDIQDKTVHAPQSHTRSVIRRRVPTPYGSWDFRLLGARMVVQYWPRDPPPHAGSAIYIARADTSASRRRSTVGSAPNRSGQAGSCHRFASAPVTAGRYLSQSRPKLSPRGDARPW